MRKLYAAVVLFCGLALASSVSAQTSTPQVQTFSLTASAIALPGNQQTLAGTVAGATLNVTTNFQLRDDNVLSSQVSFYGGGFNYFLPVLGQKLNNASPNLNGARFHIYITADAGVDQIAGKQHYAYLGGVGGFYDLTGSGSWTLGGEARYAKLPGYINNTAIVTFGPAFHGNPFAATASAVKKAASKL